MARNDIYHLATNINHAFMLYEEHVTDIMMPEYIKYLKLYGSTEQYFYPLINVDSGNGEQIYYILAITDNYPKTSIGVDSISVNGMDVKMIIIPKKRIGLYNSIIIQNKTLEYNKGFYKSAAKIISIYNGIYDNLIDVMYMPSQSITKYNLIYENVVSVCVTSIKNGNYDFAYRRYKRSVLDLEEQFVRPKLEKRLVQVLKLRKHS